MTTSPTQPISAAIFERLTALHADLERVLDGLPPEALDWTPGPGFNSLAVLITHATGAERFWIGDVAAGQASGRVREAEFHVQAIPADALRARLTETLAFCGSTLAALGDAQLADSRTSPRDGRTFSVAWCLAHALEHTAVHTGHAQLLRQLWEQHPPGLP